MTAAVRAWSKLDEEYRDTVEAEHLRRNRPKPKWCAYCGARIHYRSVTCRNCRDLVALDGPEAKG